MKALMAALGTILITAIGFAIGAVFGFFLALTFHLHGPGEVSGIGGMFNGIASGIFYALILGILSAILAGIYAYRLFKSA